jgi:hypothetical protein
VAAFSLTKHVEGTGGVLVFSDARRRASLLESARREIVRPDAATRARRAFRSAARASGTGAVLRSARRLLAPAPRERPAHRMVYRMEEVQSAGAAGAGLHRFDQWVRVDNADYRTEPSPADKERTLRELENLEENRRLRLSGARTLLGLGLTPPGVEIPADTALFKVPLFVRDREQVLSRLRDRGLDLDYIYDPPLDVYAAALAVSLPSPPESIRWSRDVLPVDPRLADRFLSILRGLPALESACA